MWMPLLLVVAAAFAAWSAHPSAQLTTRTDIPLRWEGTATVKVTFTPAVPFGAADWDGQFADARNIRFRVKEERRADVSDASGRVVGHVVWLADDGSSWDGTVNDSESHLGGAVTLDASGTGRGGVRVFGLVYRSLGDGDPLAATLPDGTYCLQAVLSPAIPYTLVIREENGRSERSDEESISGFLAGDCSLPRRIAMAGSPLTTDAVAAAVNGPLMTGEQFSVESRRALVGGVMSGSYDREIQAGSGTRVAAQWNVRRRLAITGVLGGVPETWRPKLDEQMAPVLVTASIDPALGVEGRFRFTLYDVSREPGYAMNVGTARGADLRFTTDQPTPMGPAEETGDGYRIETSGSHTEATVSITAYDFGAWGRLKAEVNIDGEWYDCVTSGGANHVTLPVDTNENHIWDTWERNVGAWGRPATDDEDADEDPTTRFKGDGFSMYEEYRGFFVKGRWVGLDPRYRELFVYDETSEGLGYVSSSGIITFTIWESEFQTAGRAVNFNRGYATRGVQRALHMKHASLDELVLGQVEPDVGIPNQVTEVLIDTVKLRDDRHAMESVIAHELGHAMNVDHHGDYRDGSCNGGDEGLISLWRGAFSGERSCVMSYAVATYYRSWDGRCYQWQWPEQFGTIYCLTKAGSGFNAGDRRMEDGRAMPVAGDATHGDCKHAIRLR